MFGVPLTVPTPETLMPPPLGDGVSLLTSNDADPALADCPDCPDCADGVADADPCPHA
jgi:hypothetical protein